MKNVIYFLCTMIFALLFVEQVYAGISVSPIILDFTADQPLAQNVLVSNVGKDTDYVEVTPYVVQNPGTKQEKQVRVYDPSVSGILVSPTRLIIPAGQQRYVRIMLTNGLGNSDRIYRVNFIPEIAGLITAKAAHGKEVGLHIIVGYGALITARAVNSQPNIDIIKHGQILTIKNTGNTNVMIDGKQCDSKNHCSSILGDRFYAGNQQQIKLPYNSPVTITTSWLDNTKIYTIK